MDGPLKCLIRPDSFRNDGVRVRPRILDGISAMSKQSEFAVILGLNPLFANLGAEALNKIAALCHARHLTPKEVLFQKGDSGDAHAALKAAIAEFKGRGKLEANFLALRIELWGGLQMADADYEQVRDHFFKALDALAKGKALSDILSPGPPVQVTIGRALIDAVHLMQEAHVYYLDKEQIEARR